MPPTGPRTPAGKARSSRNATKHGLLARTVVLQDEDRRKFETLLSDLLDEFHPTGPVQTALVENMAVARWRQIRLWAMEKAGLDNEIQQQQQDASPTTRAALAFRQLSDNSRSLDLMNRYETRYDRQFARSLARLEALKNKKFPNELKEVA